MDLQAHINRLYIKKANSVARKKKKKNGYGIATKILWSETSLEPRIVEAENWRYETRGGERIHHPHAYSKKGWGNMRYIRAHCVVELPRNLDAPCWRTK